MISNELFFNGFYYVDNISMTHHIIILQYSSYVSLFCYIYKQKFLFSFSSLQIFLDLLRSTISGTILFFPLLQFPSPINMSYYYRFISLLSELLFWVFFKYFHVIVVDRSSPSIVLITSYCKKWILY